MMYVTSDLHFSHKRILESRGFNTIEEHDKHMITTWNNTVAKNDTIYHLGDFCFRTDQMDTILSQLNGKKIFIRGNHDHNKHVKHLEKYGEVHTLLEIKYKNNHIVLCHFPLHFWNRYHYGSIHLFGHCHGHFEGIGKSLDVGIDLHKKPVTMDYAIELANKKEVLLR